MQTQHHGSRWKLGPAGTRLERALDTMSDAYLGVMREFRDEGKRGPIEAMYLQVVHHLCQAMAFADVRADEVIGSELQRQARAGWLAGLDLIELLHHAVLAGAVDRAAASRLRAAVDIVCRRLDRYL